MWWRKERKTHTEEREEREREKEGKGQSCFLPSDLLNSSNHSDRRRAKEREKVSRETSEISANGGSGRGGR